MTTPNEDQKEPIDTPPTGPRSKDITPTGPIPIPAPRVRPIPNPERPAPDNPFYARG